MNKGTDNHVFVWLLPVALWNTSDCQSIFPQDSHATRILKFYSTKKGKIQINIKTLSNLLDNQHNHHTDSPIHIQWFKPPSLEMGCKLRSANFIATDSSNTLLLFLHCVFGKHKFHPGLWSQTLIQSDIASLKNADTYRHYNLWTVNKKLTLMRPTKTENLTSISSILCNIDSRLWVSATVRASVWSLSCWSMLHSSWAVSSKRSSNSFSLRISAFVATCYLKKQTPKINAIENKKTQTQYKKERKKKTPNQTKSNLH